MISAKARACHCARSCAGGKIRTDRSMPTGSPRRACKGGNDQWNAEHSGIVWISLSAGD